MSDYQIFALGQISIALLFPSVAALGYYLNAPDPDAKKRASFILHSVALVLAAFYAVLVARWSNDSWHLFIWPFHLLLLGFLVGLIYTLQRYTGPRDLHFLQLFQVPSAAWIWFVGTMTITHDWL